MNKIIVGIAVLVVGGILGWYYFGNRANLPGMKIGNENTNSVPTGASGTGVTISDESMITGGGKGGVSESTTVTYTDAGYEPKEITVKAGTKVTFTNGSASGMWTASASHPTHQLLPGFDQLKSVVKGGNYEYTFTKVGTWKYHNHVKPADTGTVIVTQ